MLNWLLRKRQRPPAKPAEPPVGAKPAPLARPDAAQERALWGARLGAARGDDAALLEVARTAPLLDIKLAAVEALISETVLWQAEREFRSHDRKVHQLARQRLGAAVARRETQARGAALIATARTLAGDALLPANRLVDLDAAWLALDAALLDAAQRDEFAGLRAGLDAALREQGERELLERRWLADAARACDSLRTASAAQDAGAIEQAIGAAEALRDARPQDAPRTAGLGRDLTSAIDAAQLAAAALRAVVYVERAPPAAAPVVKPVAKPVPEPPGDVLPRLDALLEQAEAALADGRSAALQQQLQAADALLASAAGRVPPAPMRSRLQALHAEQARLSGWQRWGGALARENLVDEAEALARVAVGPAEAEAAPRLNLRVHGEAIRALRARWRELDRAGAAANQTLWLRFDAALTQAHAPVAAQQAALQAARQQNLATREAMLTALESTPVENASARDLLHALDAFHAAWRPLGPLEHTVPARARDALQQRLRQAIERAAAPLDAARDTARSEREQLVLRAERLDQEAVGAARLHEATTLMRDLQAAWKEQARALPLERAAEAALWARFRQACDSVFARRDAALLARDAEQAAAVAEREALLQRLAALDREAPDAARVLAEVEREWRAGPPLPRSAADALERRYREAHAVAGAALEERARARWQAQCDALLVWLRDCEAREQGAGQATQAAAGPALDGLPEAWRQALARRTALAQPPATTATMPSTPLIDEALLQLEAALGVPASPEALGARQALKLRALKDTLEGRAPRPAGAPMGTVERTALLLGEQALTAAQRMRLHAAIAALREAGSAPA